MWRWKQMLVCVPQTMYTHVSKCKNDKMLKNNKRKENVILYAKEFFRPQKRMKPCDLKINGWNWGTY
jgi:hypothetical protein